MVFEDYLMTRFIQQTLGEQPLWARLCPGLWKQQGAAEVNCPGTSILSGETVKKGKNTPTGKGQMETTHRGHVRGAWERAGGCCGQSGQGGPLGGGDQ